MAGIPARRVGDATKGFKPYAVADEDKEQWKILKIILLNQLETHL
jgi:hypothetical protein